MNLSNILCIFMLTSQMQTFPNIRDGEFKQPFIYNFVGSLALNNLQTNINLLTRKNSVKVVIS